MDNKIIFISPHYDDAIGSCGASVSYLIENNFLVIIVTIFCKGPAINQVISPFAQKLHKLWDIKDTEVEIIRAKENESACYSLGSKAVNLNFKDAIYRTNKYGLPLYRHKKAIFGPVHQADRGLAQGIALDLLKLSGDIYFFPIAVGNHVDHRISFCTGKMMEKLAKARVYYYRDFYYLYDQSMAIKYRNKFPEVIYLSKRHFINKLNSFGNYRSQIAMLTENNQSIENYLLNFGQSKYSEIYYRGGKTYPLKELLFRE